MKRIDYRNIASYGELRVARHENYRALKELKENLPSHTKELFVALTPKALLDSFVRYASPFLALYRQFCK